ncbi:MAG: hypothetical protein NC311_11390 [Muribaculaceae bacterium]|nr:hypothetical protein [Muribaculaceae bacterium]
MQIIEHEDEISIRIEFYIHRVIYKTKHIIKVMFNHNDNAIFNHKLQIVEELDESSFQLKGRKKDIIKAWSKVDERFIEIYKNLYPRGGIRKNAGRPQGSRTDKTERLEVCITKEEKQYLIECLESFRRQKLFIEQFPEEAKRINPQLLPQAAEAAILSGKIKVKSLSQIPERAEDKE